MRAEPLSNDQLRDLLRFVHTRTAYPRRNRVIALLSFRAGLRAREIARLRWHMVLDDEGRITRVLSVPSGTPARPDRVVPLDAPLRDALATLHRHECETRGVSADEHIVALRKGASDLMPRSSSIRFLFKYWYLKLGFTRASSHSGPKTFVLNARRHRSRSSAIDPIDPACA